MILDIFKTKVLVVVIVISLLIGIFSLFLPSDMLIISIILSISAIVISCIGFIVLIHQDIKSGVINLEKTNVKKWLKEYYKLMIFLLVYTVIIFSVFMVVEIVYAIIISGIIIGITVVSIEVCFRINERRIRKIESKE